MALMQYLRDTKSELNHVSWPTRTQTAIFTALVMIISVIVSLYLGVFDYLFTNALGKVIEFIPVSEPTLDLSEFNAISPTSTEFLMETPTAEDLIPGLEVEVE